MDALKPSPATGNNDELPILISDEASDAIVTDDSEPVGVQPPIEPPEVTGAGAAGMAGEGEGEEEEAISKETPSTIIE